MGVELGDPRVLVVVWAMAMYRVVFISIWPHGLKNLLWLNGGIQLPCKREWLLSLAHAELVAHGSSDYGR